MTRGLGQQPPHRRIPVVVPEHDTVFRLAQLVLLLSVVAAVHPEGVHMERLGIYDFISANPLLMATEHRDPDRLSLQMQGFDDRALSYASPAQRFTTRREQLQHDLALLIAYGLVIVSARGHVFYRSTPDGYELASKFTAMYAKSYMHSAGIVVRRLRKLSDGKLRDNLAIWTGLSRSASGASLELAAVVDPRNSDTADPTMSRLSKETA
jgi:hypothetical protein